jgi:hypothetical protein
MTRAQSGGRFLLVAALTVAGVAAGHVAEYVALAPEDQRRQELLAHTGHGYLPFAVRVAGFLGVFALVAVFMAAAARSAHGGDRDRPDLRWAGTLPVAQSVGFIALELIERVVAHASLGDLPAVLLAGVPIQIVVGLLGRSLIRALGRAGGRVGLTARLHGRRRPRSSVVWRPPAHVAPWPPVPNLVAAPRGPPAFLAPH